jgi:ankyrin repeat protein
VLDSVEEQAKHKPDMLYQVVRGAISDRRSDDEAVVALQDIVKLTGKQSVDYQDPHGLSALMLAARSGYPKMAQVLLGFGANPGLKDAEGHTALELAHLRGDSAVEAVLTAARAR